MDTVPSSIATDPPLQHQIPVETWTDSTSRKHGSQAARFALVGYLRALIPDI